MIHSLAIIDNMELISFIISIFNIQNIFVQDTALKVGDICFVIYTVYIMKSFPYKVALNCIIANKQVLYHLTDMHKTKIEFHSDI